MTKYFLEKNYIHRIVADFTALTAINVTGRDSGLLVQVIGEGLFGLESPGVATPNGRDVIVGSGGAVWLRLTQENLKTTAAGDIATAANLAGGSIYTIPYQLNTGVTDYLPATPNSVFTTDGSGLPYPRNSLPENVTIGDSKCYDPVTAANIKLDTSLDNLYNFAKTTEVVSITPAVFNDNPAASSWQIIPGSAFTLQTGSYQITYKIDAGLFASPGAAENSKISVKTALYESSVAPIVLTELNAFQSSPSEGFPFDDTFQSAVMTYTLDVISTTTFELAMSRNVLGPDPSSSFGVQLSNMLIQHLKIG